MVWMLLYQHFEVVQNVRQRGVVATNQQERRAQMSHSGDLYVSMKNTDRLLEGWV